MVLACLATASNSASSPPLVDLHRIRSASAGLLLLLPVQVASSGASMMIHFSLNRKLFLKYSGSTVASRHHFLVSILLSARSTWQKPAYHPCPGHSSFFPKDGHLLLSRCQLPQRLVPTYACTACILVNNPCRVCFKPPCLFGFSAELLSHLLIPHPMVISPPPHVFLLGAPSRTIQQGIPHCSCWLSHITPVLCFLHFETSFYLLKPNCGFLQLGLCFFFLRVSFFRRATERPKNTVRGSFFWGVAAMFFGVVALFCGVGKRFFFGVDARNRFFWRGDGSRWAPALAVSCFCDFVFFLCVFLVCVFV